MPSISNTEPTTNGYASIPPYAMPLISPSALLQAHLSQTPPRRPSNRLPTECRQISLNTSSLTHTNGSALVRIGDTAVVCGVRAEILPVHEIANYKVKKTQIPVSDTNNNSSKDVIDEENYSEISTNALLVPNIELATGCSPNHLPGGPPSVEAQSLSQRLLSLLHISRIIRPSDLKISYTLPPEAIDEEEKAKGPQLKAYWTLYIDIVCISYGGSVFDAAWMAMYAALRDTLLPKAWWDGDLGTVLCSPEMAEGQRLDLRGSPVPLSFGAFVPEAPVKNQSNIGEAMWVLCDIDAFEEECCEERGCVVVDWSGEVVKLEKSGGGMVGMSQIKGLVIAAGKRWQMWDQVLKAGEVDERRAERLRGVEERFEDRRRKIGAGMGVGMGRRGN